MRIFEVVDTPDSISPAICEERIVTNRSGLFGWGDTSDFTTYVYDRDGRITEGIEARKVKRNGKTYAEVRIPEGYSAAIVRNRPTAPDPSARSD